MKKEKLFNLLLDALVVFSVLAAMYIKQVDRTNYTSKPYGDMRISPVTNERFANVYRPYQEIFFFTAEKNNKQTR